MPRQLTKIIKIVVASLVYFAGYLTVSYTVLTPKTTYNFISDKYRVGDKYVLIFLTSSPKVFTDVEGVDVFQSRKCFYCFMTNNKGFMTLEEFDAVLVYSEDQDLLLPGVSVSVDPSKRYILTTDKWCLENKLTNCDSEPQITSFVTGEDFDVCGLCEHLHEKRKRALESPVYRVTQKYDSSFYEIGSSGVPQK